LNLYGFIRNTPIALIDYLGLIAAGDVISTELRDINSLCQPNSRLNHRIEKNLDNRPVFFETKPAISVALKGEFA